MYRLRRGGGRRTMGSRRKIWLLISISRGWPMSRFGGGHHWSGQKKGRVGKQPSLDVRMPQRGGQVRPRRPSLPLQARQRKGRVDQCDGRSGTLYIAVRAWQCRRRLAERTVSGSAERGDGSHCFKPTPWQRALKVSGRRAFAQSRNGATSSEQCSQRG